MDKQLILAAQDYLFRKENQKINMLAALRCGVSTVVEAGDDGCLLCTSGNIWQIAAEDEKTALRLYERIPEDAVMLEIQEESQIDVIAERFKPRCIETYYNVWYAKDTIELPDHGIEIRTMTENDADFLAVHYHMPGPDTHNVDMIREYMLDRIASGTMFGVFLDGQIVGFAGNHDEGSIGMLTVLPEFRRRGLGTYLEQVAISRALERGHIPFGQVARNNAASLELQRSIGMTISEELVCWMDK